MLILRDVYYSAIDENGEERLFSTNEVVSESEYVDRLFADSWVNKIKKKLHLGKKEAEQVAEAAQESAKEAIAEEGKAKKNFIKKGWEATKALPGKYFEGVGKQGEKLAGKNNKVIKALGEQIAKHNKVAGTGLAVAGTAGLGAAGYGGYKGVKALKNRKNNKE